MNGRARERMNFNFEASTIYEKNEIFKVREFSPKMGKN